MREDSLNLFQWNCRSIKENPVRRAELKVLAYAHKPHILCISETWLTQEKPTPDLIKYPKSFRKDRPNREGGGLLTIVREDIIAREIDINTRQDSKIEAQAIEITLKHEKIKLLHIYNPETNININDFGHLVYQLGRKFIIVGDMNGHHTLWDPNNISNNQCGNELSDYILNNPTIALATTPGLKTYTNNNGRTSTIDLTLCSPNLLPLVETISMAGHGSDHYPIHTKVNITPEKITRTKRPKWKLKEDKWDEWRDRIPQAEEYHETTEAGDRAFGTSLKDPAKEIFGKTSSQIKSKFSKPWWTPECSREIARRRRARKAMERRPTTANIIEYKRCAARAKRCIKKAKKETWRKFCNNLTPETPTKAIWNMIRKMNGNSISRNITLKENGRIITDEETQAKIFADRIQELGDNAINHPITEEQKLRIEEAKNNQQDIDYNARFSMEELQECIRTLPSEKVTGEDEVHNKFLKNLPAHKMTELLRLANKSFRTTDIPNNWKKSLVIPIPKARKDLTDPSSYRPI